MLDCYPICQVKPSVLLRASTLSQLHIPVPGNCAAERVSGGVFSDGFDKVSAGVCSKDGVGAAAVVLSLGAVSPFPAGDAGCGDDDASTLPRMIGKPMLIRTDRKDIYQRKRKNQLAIKIADFTLEKTALDDLFSGITNLLASSPFAAPRPCRTLAPLS